MRELLRGAHVRLTAALDAGGIRHHPAESGVFVLLDLRSHLKEPTWEAEHQLWLRILEQANVSLTPGSACRVGEPGFFRLCYAGQPTENVEVAVERIVKLLG
jgi:1-aminocyclopropane-1-carboxylate synthase